MAILNIDFVGPFPTKEYILVIIDTRSRWIELLQCPDATAESVSHALLAPFGRYGCPQQIRSDQGSHFVNATTITSSYSRPVSCVCLKTCLIFIFIWQRDVGSILFFCSGDDFDLTQN